MRGLARVAKEKSISLIHISTDYVFDGMNYKPYAEDDYANPQCVYGKTKYAGELAICEINPKNSIIIRTSWVYSVFGNNFVKTMFELANKKSLLNVVCDQIGSPTSARDLAKAILEIIPQLNNKIVETYHYSSSGVCSWYDFAKEILSYSESRCRVNPIFTVDYPTPAKRPLYSVFNKNKIVKDYGVEIPYWRDSLEATLFELKRFNDAHS